jgi:transposase, IS30 family
VCALAPALWPNVERLLLEKLSPEQVGCRLLAEGRASLSHETIYKYIYSDKANGGTLVSHLRCQKERRKRYGSGKDRRGQLQNRVGIEHRPAIVDTRSRIGDWEGDTVVGAGNSGVLLTLVERHSRRAIVRWLPNREAEPVSAALIEMLRPHRDQCLTITTDNGKEFADHVFYGQCLGADVYFARPYHSWERGSIENFNGLLRQYFPKKMSFKDVTQEQVDFAVNQLNNRPRKCLGFKTPNEVFYDTPIPTLQ